MNTIPRGAVSAIGWARWSATARCTSPAKVFAIPAAALEALFEDRPELGYRFMRRLGGVISQRLHHRTDKLVDAGGEAFDGETI